MGKDRTNIERSVIKLSEKQQVANAFNFASTRFILRSAEEHIRSSNGNGVAFVSSPLCGDDGKMDLNGITYLRVVRFEKPAENGKKTTPKLTAENEQIVVCVKTEDLLGKLQSAPLKPGDLIWTTVKCGQLHFQQVPAAKQHDGVRVANDKASVARRKTVLSDFA